MKIHGKKLENLIEYLNGNYEGDIFEPYISYSEDMDGYVTKVILLKDARLLLKTIRELYDSQKVVAHTEP